MTLLLRKVLVTEILLFKEVAEILSHRMNGYTQINVKKANLLYRRPANQNLSNSSMTNKVHDAHLMLLVFLDLKEQGIFR